MKVITEGYDYEVPNVVNPNLTQAIHLVQAVPNGDGRFIVARDGTNLKELLAVVLHALEHHDSIVPDYHNEISKSLVKSAYNHLKQREEERIALGIKGTNKVTQEVIKGLKEKTE